MFHSPSHPSFPAGKCRPSPFPAFRFAAACLGASLAVAQETPELPPLQATVSADGENYSSSLAGHDGFVFIRCTAESGTAGAWYRAVASAAIHSEGYFTAGGLQQMRPTTVELGTVASAFLPYEENSYLGEQWLVDAHPLAVHATLALLLEDQGHASAFAVQNTGALLPYASPEIVHEYNSFANHGWLIDSDTGAFNVDSIRQAAIWANVADAFPNQQAFFDSVDYLKICAYDVEIRISLLGVRGPDVVPASGMQPPDPPLDGYPFAPPKLTRSGPALVTYAGTGAGNLNFVAAGGQAPIFFAPQGGTVHIPAAGYSPGMQLALCSLTSSPSQHFDVSAQWSSLGKIKAIVPAAAAPGTFEFRYYRYRVLGPNGPTYLPWQLIPPLQRPRILVTQG